VQQPTPAHCRACQAPQVICQGGHPGAPGLLVPHGPGTLLMCRRPGAKASLSTSLVWTGTTSFFRLRMRVKDTACPGITSPAAALNCASDVVGWRQHPSGKKMGPLQNHPPPKSEEFHKSYNPPYFRKCLQKLSARHQLQQNHPHSGGKKHVGFYFADHILSGNLQTTPGLQITAPLGKL